jgi:serine/threonine protein kinase/WD40 repeat protein/tetratricopeptide (TPR) repeat protein
MKTSSGERNPVELLAEDFLDRKRRGERPTLQQYVEGHPELAEQIRDLFPALLMMEDLGESSGGTTGSLAADGVAVGTRLERLGDYRILREIGRGGMGVVYEAEQESLGRRVALKVLSVGALADPKQVRRFEREAKAAARLHHTNIVPVFGVGQQDGHHYFVMQFIAGVGLDVVLDDLRRLRQAKSEATRTAEPAVPASRIAGLSAADVARSLLTGRFEADGPLGDGSMTEPFDGAAPAPPSADNGPLADPFPAILPGSSELSASSDLDRQFYHSIARIGIQVAEALEYANRQGILHRDVKPSNLLLDNHGNVWVADFGLAKTAEADDLTHTGDLLGTIRYMAPERFSGHCDARSDVYSLGLTLYELVALRPAYEASDRHALMDRVLHEEPERLKKLAPRVPRDLETIVAKATARDPECRYTTAAALAEDLRRYVEDRPIRARRLSLAERLWRWSRRNPALAASSLVAAALAVLLVIGSVWAALFYRQQRDEVARSRDQALAAERERSAELVRSLLQQARAERLSGGSDRRDAALTALTRAAGIAREIGAPPEDLARLRDEVIAALALDDPQVVRSWSGLEGDSRIAAYAPGADRYIVVGEDGTIHVHRLSDRSELRTVGAGRPMTRSRPLLSADGRFLSFWAVPSLTELWDLERGEVPAAWPADVRGVAFRADGRQMAALRADGELRLYQLPAMAESARHRLGLDVPGLFHYRWMSLSGDGRRLAIARTHWDAVDIYDTASGLPVCAVPTARATSPLAPRNFGAVALDHAGALLAVAHDATITTYDLADGGVLARLRGDDAQLTFLLFQPGGGLLATSGRDNLTRLWDPIRGRLLATFPGGLNGWDADRSRLLILRDRDLAAYQLGGAVGRRTIDGRALGDPPGRTTLGPARAAYSPDGRLIALPFDRDGVRLVRASDGAPLARLPIGECDEARFLPDGGLLTYNKRGLYRWPLRHVAGGAWRLGPPEPLLLPKEVATILAGMDAAASGHVVGVSDPMRRGAVLLDPDRPARRTWLVQHRGVYAMAISPDGRWAATGSWHPGPDGRDVLIWDAADGAPAARLEAGNARVAFSPDGRWLGVGGVDRYRFYRVGSWSAVAEVEHGHAVGFAPLAFHPGGRLAAVVDTSGMAARLVEVETGRVLATLEPPDPAAVALMSFSPDGRYLAVPQDDQRVHVWDLAAIRRELDALGLAAGIPDIFGGGEPAGDRPAVDRIEVEGADPARLFLLMIRQVLHEVGVAVRNLGDPRLDDPMELVERGDRWYRMGQWRRAEADYRAALARRPEAVILNHALAQLLAEGPGRGDPEEAVRRAQLAVRGWPQRLLFRRTLGLALYRAGRYAEAAAELDVHIPHYPDEAGLDGLALAMCRRRQGRPAEARVALTEALRWRAARPDLRSDRAAAFDRLLREAESVLNEALPDLPTDVFARE